MVLMVGAKAPLSQWLYRTFSGSAARFVTLPRVNRRFRHLAVLATACCACAAAAAPAAAFTAAEGRAAADRAAMAWGRDHQQKDGAIIDYVAQRPTYGYATLMIGYGLVRAGVRHHDPRVVRSGFRAIDAALRRNNPHRGVFDELVNATAYSWVRKHLPHDPSFRALRARWERYLVTIAEPFIGSSGLKRCMAARVPRVLDGDGRGRRGRSRATQPAGHSPGARQDHGRSRGADGAGRRHGLPGPPSGAVVGARVRGLRGRRRAAAPGHGGTAG